MCLRVSRVRGLSCRLSAVTLTGAALARTFDNSKFRELVLYVAEESEEDPRFGATKLNKILYFSDFKAFGMLGESITGATYQRLDRGPAPRELLPALRSMEAEGELERFERHYFNRPQKVIRPLRRSEASEVLAPAELAIVDAVLADLKELNASQVSALSHLEAGWRLARDREEIPYETVYISDRQPTPTEVAAWERALAERRATRSSS